MLLLGKSYAIALQKLCYYLVIAMRLSCNYLAILVTLPSE